MAPDELLARISFDLEAIEKTHSQLTRLRTRVGDASPDEDQLAAMAAYLHGIYGGVESVLKLLAEHHGVPLEQSAAWHARLLERFSEGHAGCLGPPLISPDLKQRLDELRGFRHVFRSHYAFHLDWSRLRVIVDSEPETWGLFREAIRSHMASL